MSTPTTSANTPVNICIFICGVCGSGKTTVGTLLAEQLGWPYLEADRFHPKENVDKMTSGIALTDEDRWPWLTALADATAQAAQEHSGAVTSCSALKVSYRQYLSDSIASANRGQPTTTRFMLLNGDRETLRKRMATRSGHFMPESLLDSQLATLELPGADEENIDVYDITDSATQIADTIARQAAIS